MQYTNVTVLQTVSKIFIAKTQLIAYLYLLTSLWLFYLYQRPVLQQAAQTIRHFSIEFEIKEQIT